MTYGGETYGGSALASSSTTYKHLHRGASVSGNGSIDVSRAKLLENRSVTIYGAGAATSTRIVVKPRSSSLYGTGAIDNQIIGFIDTADVTSHVDPIHSFAENERTSLELIDFDVTYDDEERVWYTPWMPEDKITDNEHDIAILSNVAPQGKDPAARIIVQYSEDTREVDDESEPVYVDNDELVREITALPTDEDGYYRLKIGEYSGYNDITNINMGFVH